MELLDLTPYVPRMEESWDILAKIERVRKMGLVLGWGGSEYPESLVVGDEVIPFAWYQHPDPAVVDAMLELTYDNRGMMELEIGKTCLIREYVSRLVNTRMADEKEWSRLRVKASGVVGLKTNGQGRGKHEPWEWRLEAAIDAGLVDVRAYRVEDLKLLPRSVWRHLSRTWAGWTKTLVAQWCMDDWNLRSGLLSAELLLNVHLDRNMRALVFEDVQRFIRDKEVAQGTAMAVLTQALNSTTLDLDERERVMDWWIEDAKKQSSGYISYHLGLSPWPDVTWDLLAQRADSVPVVAWNAIFDVGQVSLSLARVLLERFPRKASRIALMKNVYRNKEGRELLLGHTLSTKALVRLRKEADDEERVEIDKKLGASASGVRYFASKRVTPEAEVQAGAIAKALQKGSAKARADVFGSMGRLTGKKRESR